jgi:flagellar protein FlgJ
MDVNSAFDFDGLQSIKNQARRDPLAAPGSATAGTNGGSNPALRKAAEQFEALFIQEMLKSMRASVEKDELTNNTHMETYEALFDREVSLQMAKRGAVGIADMLVGNLERQQSAAQVLNQRALETPSAPKPKRLEEREYGRGLPSDKTMPLNPATMPGMALPIRPQNFPIDLNPFKTLK